MKGKYLTSLTMLGLMASINIAAKQQDPHVVATPQFYGTKIAFSAQSTSRNTTLSISGPNDFTLHTFKKNGLPAIDLLRDDPLADGLYHYELTSATGKLMEFKDTMDNGRGANTRIVARKGIVQSGHFRVVNGQIKHYKAIKEPTSHQSLR